MLVGYMRISTTDERQSVDLQRDALLAVGVDERHLHEDRASGARDDRPGLKACLADLRRGDVLVVWKLDRLGRSLSHLIQIVDQLKMREVAFRSLTEAIDTTTPHGEFLFNLFGSLAQYERALIKERVVAGLAAARRRGRKGGRPPTIDLEKVEQIIRALEGGASKASICRSFKVPRSTLLDTLKRAGWTGPAARPEARRPLPRQLRPAAASWPRPFQGSDRWSPDHRWRFNRRFQLDSLIPRFVHAATRTAPLPYRILVAG
jgi:DNA invertase Pin-like site-specific DNA recombinase